MSRTKIQKDKFEEIVAEIYTEYLFALHHYPPFSEEQTALREIQKQFSQLNNSPPEKRSKQAVELAAMCIRYLIDCGKI